MTAQIQLAQTDTQIERCYPVMVQLRPHLTGSQEFLERVKRQMARDGFQLAYLEDNDQVKAVAGFRINEMLSRGRFLYLDDLVTDAQERSTGYGATLFSWLIDYAKSQNCEQFELDSGVERYGAHRFYFRQRMNISGYHFRLRLL